MDTQRKPTSSSPEDRIPRIQSLIQQEKFSQALEEIQKLENGAGVDLSHSEKGDLSHLACVCLFHLGRCKEALAKAAHAFEVFRNTSENKRVAQIQYMLGRISLRLGDPGSAELHVSDALSTYRRIRNQGEMVNCYNLIAQICFAKCDFEKSTEYLHKAKELSEKVGDIRMAALIGGNLGRVYTLLGNWRQAEESLEISLRFNQTNGAELGLCKDLLSLGFLSFLKEDYLRSSSLLARALEVVRNNDFFRELAIYYEYAGQLAHRTGDEETAATCFLEAIEIGQTACPEGYIRSQTYRLLAELQVVQKKFDQALTSCQKSLEASKSLGERLEEGAAYRILGQIYSAKGEKDRSRGYFQRSKLVLQRIGAKYELARTCLEAGQSPAFDYYKRLGFLSDAESLFRALNSSHHLGLVNLAIADLLVEQKEYGNARVFLTEGERLFKESNDRRELRHVTNSKRAIEEAVFQSRMIAKSNGKVTFDNIVTQNAEMREIIERLKQIKDCDIGILIEGPTGTGKDLMAKATHYSSTRRDGRFVAVNCAERSESLLENELFGHKRGAYTGADKDQTGLFEEAGGGTLYLDQVEEMPKCTQVKLLRAIEEKEITPLGGTKPRKVNVRIISSSIKDLREEVKNGRFRQDIYFRLNIFRVKIPALRERKEDIPLLVRHFLRQYLRECGMEEKVMEDFDRDRAVERFLGHEWSGNVRELENDIKRIVILAQASSKGLSEFLPEKLKRSPGDVALNGTGPLPDQVARFEREKIIEALEQTRGNKSGAARLLGIPEGTLRSKMNKYKTFPPGLAA